MAELTPMMKQYTEIKEQNPDCILFFRLGDFYEMFNDDAKLASRELDLTLTTRDRAKEKEDRIPMCGVPHHSCEAYIARLIEKGYKVAICEQTEDPALAKGLVSREVVRVITPGTIMEGTMLDEGKNNFIASVFLENNVCGLCFADISTGEVFLTSVENDIDRVKDDLSRFSPAEALLSPGAQAAASITGFLSSQPGCLTEKADSRRFEFSAACEELFSHFEKDNLEDLGLSAYPETARAFGALLSYLKETQKTKLSHLRRVQFYSCDQFMQIDATARRNLELTETIRSNKKTGSLLGILDKTKTSMGRRTLRSWLEKPLLNPVQIQKRHRAVGELAENHVLRSELIAALSEISDMERLIGRVVYGSAGGKDLRSLCLSVGKLPQIKSFLSRFESPLFKELYSRLDVLEDVHKMIDSALVDDPPFSVREGGIIRDGYNGEVDMLRDIMSGGKNVVASIETRERERTGIKNLKIGYNKVFGYYIEITKANYDLTPSDYIRKQTLANCERFITQELKELEATILGASNKITSLEYDLFCALRRNVAECSERIQETACIIGQTDVLCSLAETAVKNNYCMPEVDLSETIDIKMGRHPVVECTIKDSLFVPNDIYLDSSENLAAIITGPNMAGKSTYMRQVALIVIMAQMGSFVPAKSARIGIVDKVFTRIGASDDLSAGQSTFMLEMTETSEMLKNATSKSLLILDEIGRGTSTFDGMAIAKAVLEHSVKKLKAKTLFATHYHELTVLENELSGVKNFNIAAKKRGDDLIFLRKIVPGGADESYGIEVAKLAGMPKSVVKRAKEILSTLESDEFRETPVSRGDSGNALEQLSAFDQASDEILQTLRNLSLDTITPIEAINILYELKKQAK